MSEIMILVPMDLLRQCEEYLSCDARSNVSAVASEFNGGPSDWDDTTKELALVDDLVRRIRKCYESDAGAVKP